MVDEKATPDVVADDDSDESKTYDAEYVRKLKAEAKGYRQDKAALKKDYDDTKAKLTALEADKLTDTEKKENRIKELEKQLADIDASVKAGKLDNLILKAVSGKNFVDIDTVTMLIKKSLESEEDSTDKTVEKVIDNIIKTKPYLVASVNVNPSDGNFKKTDNEISKKPLEQLNAFISGKTDKLS